jgi:MSHA biogenesis protein MshP
MVSVVMILVVLAGLGTALAGLSARQHMGAAAQLEHSRAYQASRAGLEWAAFQVLRNPAPPAAAPSCFSSTNITPGGTLSGFVVTVSCTQSTATDGATSLTFYQVVANACNVPSGGGCPNPSAAPAATYVERQISWTLAR